MNTYNQVMKIAVLHHLHTDIENSSCYLVNYLCRNWIQQGHSVIHVIGVDDPLPDADLLIMHVNLTVVPQEYVQVAEHYPMVVNRNIIDISKPAFSKMIIGPDDIYDGPVIVKTKNNYGGLPERKINRLNSKHRLDRILKKFQERFEWMNSWSRIEWLIDYPVYETKKKLPRGIWKNENLVVEKFLPERGKDGDYHVREWIFLGDREIHFVNISREPIVKSANVYRRKHLTADEVPIELKMIRNEFGFDYGKFDYGINNGTPVVYDINKTPGASRNLYDRRPEAFDHIKKLSQGVEFYLR